MNAPDSRTPARTPTGDISGAAMDTVMPRKPWQRWRAATVALASAVLGAAALLIWMRTPGGLEVKRSDLTVATATNGMFLDEVIARATVMPLNAVMLDAVEGGRVEEVLAKDGVEVKKGELLFRLNNPQARLDILARQADQAQQISNVSNLRVGLEVGRSEARQRVIQQRHELAKVERETRRSEQLAAQNFISPKALEDAQESLRLAKELLDEFERRAEEEDLIRQESLRQLEHSMRKINAGLDLVVASADAMNVRAPTAGRLNDFSLQVGALVKPGDRIGRIDPPGEFKLVVPIDEFYLNRVSTGLPAQADVNGTKTDLLVQRVYAQIKSGRFTIDLAFKGAPPPGLHPGQTVDVRLTLGEATSALLLPSSAFVHDTGGSWAYVVEPGGSAATKRAITIGRRSNRQLEVTSGLKAGEEVIVSGYALYGTADRLVIKNSTTH